MSAHSNDFSLYLSGVTVKEDEFVELELRYEGFNDDIERLILIGENNGLSSNVAEGKEFSKKISGTQAIFTISFPIWEDGTFRAVIETDGNFIYEPGESHSLVFRGKGVFLDLRKIYHLQKEPQPPPEQVSSPKEAKAVVQPKDTPQPKKTEPKEKTIPLGYDEFNKLILKPKDFRSFCPSLKEKILQILDYLTNKQSMDLDLDFVILPEIARSLKQCIIEENRKSVFDICSPVVVVIQKALMFSNMVLGSPKDEELKELYVKEVVEPAKLLIEEIKQKEFKPTSELMKREYDDDVHNLKMELLQYI